ncbi:MAG: porin family protein [Acidobacteria bacterium]|jgi:hypothetical protein|nr:porin family protein [Acidobacteriota bacterium]
MKGLTTIKRLGFSMLLVFVLMAFPSSQIFAQDEESFNKSLKLAINAGLAIARQDFTNQPHGNFFLHFRFPWISPRPEPPYPEFGIKVGYSAFKWDVWIPENENLFYWWNINPTFRLTFGRGVFKPYVGVGPGVYIPKDGNARFGLNGSIGFDYQFNDKFLIEIGGDYHYIFLDENNILGENMDFFHIHTGVAILL